MTRSINVDWQGAADVLAKLIPTARLEPAVIAWAEKAPRRQRWSIAFSGGADSLALLLLVWAHWPKRRRTLRALHFDHRLRGPESRADAVFCRRVCRNLGVEFVSGRWVGGRRGASEAEAREARMNFFGQHARVVWLGHQQDDIAESMMMRLSRGSGTGGLAAPRPLQPMPRGRLNVRPLLSVKKSDILASLREAGVRWCEDSTNAKADYFRNRIRRDVLPAWTAAAQRDALAGAARSRYLLDEDDLALDLWLNEIAPFGAGHLDLTLLAGKPRAILRRALHRWLAAEPRAGEISRQAFDTLLNAVEQGKPTRQSIGRAGFAVIAGGALRFEPAGTNRPKFHPAAN